MYESQGSMSPSGALSTRKGHTAQAPVKGGGIHGGRQIGKQFQLSLSEELPRAKLGFSPKELSLYRNCTHL